MATVDYRLCGAVYPSLDRYCNEHLLENIKGSLHPNYKETYCLTYLCELGEALSVGQRKNQQGQEFWDMNSHLGLLSLDSSLYLGI